MIAKTIEAATPALDYDRPLPSGDQRYVDFAAGRGDRALEKLRKRLERRPEDGFLRLVLASHRGAGKSTEILRLQQLVASKYLPIYFVANVEMDGNRFQMEDLLLVIARWIEAALREAGTPLAAERLDAVERWFRTVVFEDEEGRRFLAGIEGDARIEVKLPFLAKLLAALTSSFKIESSHRERTQSTLRKFPGTLMAHVNALLDDANAILGQRGKSLLLLIDNMDRYPPRVIDELLEENADRFRELRCHLLITPPIDLLLRPEMTAIGQLFETEFMPTVKVRERGSPYTRLAGAGPKLLLEALARRIDIDALIPEPSARERLIAASGGAIRELLELAKRASLESDGPTITLEAVERTLSQRRHRMRTVIDANAGWWAALRRFRATNRLDGDEASLEVVFHRLVFEYNGEIWYDVHPLVAELLDQEPAST